MNILKGCDLVEETKIAKKSNFVSDNQNLSEDNRKLSENRSLKGKGRVQIENCNSLDREFECENLYNKSFKKMDDENSNNSNLIDSSMSNETKHLGVNGNEIYAPARGSNQELSKVKINRRKIEGLDSKKILEKFNYFGQILNSRFSESFIELQYESKEAAINAKRAIQANIMPEFTLYTNKYISEADKLSKNQSKTHEMDNLVKKEKKRCNEPIFTFNMLKITPMIQNTTLEYICRLLSSICIPSRIIEAIDKKTKRMFYLAEFKNVEESLDVMNALQVKLCGRNDLTVSPSFESI